MDSKEDLISRMNAVGADYLIGWMVAHVRSCQQQRCAICAELHLAVKGIRRFLEERRSEKGDDDEPTDHP
jgi:hypothetical protein